MRKNCFIAENKKSGHLWLAFLVRGISTDWTCTGLHTHYRTYTRVWKYVQTHSLDLEVFHFIRAVSLEIATDETIRGDEPSAVGYVFLFQDTFSASTHIRSHVYVHAEPLWTIIKKIEGECSLLILVWLTAVPLPRTQARYWIPSFFKRNRIVLHLSRFLHIRPISESLSSRDPHCHYFCPVNGTRTYVSLYVRMADERGSPRVSTRRKSEILSLQWPFVFLLWNPRNGFCDVESASMPGFSRR